MSADSQPSVPGVPSVLVLVAQCCSPSPALHYSSTGAQGLTVTALKSLVTGRAFPTSTKPTKRTRKVHFKNLYCSLLHRVLYANQQTAINFLR